MPYCKVRDIRLCNDDPRAMNCGERDLQNIDNLLVRGSPMVCDYCKGHCECDHPTWTGFTIKIENFDEQFKVKEIKHVLKKYFNERCGELKCRKV
jgi:hypothetical protein